MAVMLTAFVRGGFFKKPASLQRLLIIGNNCFRGDENLLNHYAAKILSGCVIKR
jgi:hypothetical protein